MTFFIFKHGSVESVFFMQPDGRRSFVPTDPANTDYQRYLDWLAAGGVPEVIES